MKARLIVLCGLPGSGKTTLAKKLAAESPGVRLCPDEWLAKLGIDLFDESARERLEAVLREHAYELLSLGQTVILEFGFWAREERDEVRLRARAIGAAVELRYLDVPLDELWRRLEVRNGTGTPDTAVVTRAMIEQWAGQIEAPDQDEHALFDAPPG
ncbi:AAA family ATPase [Nonomuraea endophytica]|uniref:Putative kinase n=1 Tax=Nonomuraea endophytica TaxID=714136 RepID=A0A7W8ADP0_9ACTN|nr:ATP-binding protein [Nonomuraea endophytica]MBB5083779.1 putative kinase [Nonomuraea endophytica]